MLVRHRMLWSCLREDEYKPATLRFPISKKLGSICVAPTTFDYADQITDVEACEDSAGCEE